MAAREILMHWGFGAEILDSLPQAFQVVQKTGDLGNKLTPREASRDLFFVQDPLTRMVFDNGINNSGNIRIFHNAQAPLQKTCLVFGDSFGTNLAEAFTGTFAEVVYAYRPASFDQTLAEIVQPEFTVLEITQRFLVGQPDRSQSIFDMALTKLGQMDPVKRGQLVATYENWSSTPFAPFVDPVLARI
jgi:hypothetical protein